MLQFNKVDSHQLFDYFSKIFVFIVFNHNIKYIVKSTKVKLANFKTRHAYLLT